MAGSHDERWMSLRLGPEVVRDRVAGHRATEQPLDLGVDGLHPHLGAGGTKNRNYCLANRSELAAPVGPAGSLSPWSSLLVGAAFRETLEEVGEGCV